MRIHVKRAYEEPSPDDGYRVLVDRVWPRGVSKEKAKLDQWMTDVSPSTDLRKWFGHDPEKWLEFKARYKKELAAHEDLVEELRRIARHGTLTLVFGARDTKHNNAVALRQILENA